MRVNTGIPDCLFLTKRLNFWFLMYTQLTDIPVITIQLETLIAKHPYTLHCLQRIRLCLGLSDPTISTAVLYPWQIRMLTQSPLGTANSFCVDVVSDSFNKTSRDEDNILDEKYKKQMCSYYYYVDFNYL